MNHADAENIDDLIICAICEICGFNCFICNDKAW